MPSIYTSLAEWRAEHESDTNRHQPKVPEDKLVRLAGRAGSLVVFHRLMPHTNTVNTSDLPRYVQYVAMQPRGTEEERDVRVKEFQERRPPAWAVRQKITGQLIPEPGDPPPLTDLGRKLVGLDSWP